MFDELTLWATPFALKLLDKIRYKKGIHALDIRIGIRFPLTGNAMRLGKDSKGYGVIVRYTVVYGGGNNVNI